LPKDRRLVLDHPIPPTQHTNRLAHNLASKGYLGSWSNADCHVRIFGRSKSSCACTKVARRQLVANSRGAGFYAVKDLGTPQMGKPLSQSEVYPFPLPSASTKSEPKLELQPRHVRFTPKSRHHRVLLSCPLWAKSRHTWCSKRGAAKTALLDHLIGSVQ
jgi:hypothetical protein